MSVFTVEGMPARLLINRSLGLYEQPGAKLIHIEDKEHGPHFGLLDTDSGRMYVFDAPALLRLMRNAAINLETGA